MKNCKIIIYLFFVMLFSSFTHSLFLRDVQATIRAEDKVYKLAILQGVEECYYQFGLRSTTDPNPNIKSIFDFSNNTFKDVEANTVFIPTHVGNTLNNNNAADSDLSCKQVFVGYKKDNKQAVGLFGKDGENINGGLYSPSSIDSLEKYGYVKTTNAADDSGATEKKFFAKITGNTTKIKIDNEEITPKTSGEIICWIELEIGDGKEGSFNDIGCYNGSITWSLEGTAEGDVTYKITNNNTEFSLDGVGNTDGTKKIIGSLDWDTDDSHPDYLWYQVKDHGYASALKGECINQMNGANIPNGCIDIARWDPSGSFVNGRYPLDEHIADEIIYDLTGARDRDAECVNDNSCIINIENYTEQITAYEQLKQLQTGMTTPKYVPKLSARVLLNNLGIDNNLPTDDFTANNVKNYPGETVTGEKYVWNNAYVYSLYYYYLKELSTENGGKLSFKDCADKRPEANDPDNFWFRNAYQHEGTESGQKPMWCKIPKSDVSDDDWNKKYSIYDKDSGMLKLGLFADVIVWFNNDNNYEGMGEGDFADMKLNDQGYLRFGSGDVEQPTNPGDDDATGSVSATCQNAAGAGAMGWIICPILEWVGNSATNLYSSYVEPRLKINPKLFQVIEGTDKSPTRDAWGTFQTIANVVFIIILLLVIFSQLTGIGIDNYGIKRILPKLVVVAILVNLSYVICVICVDLSNILGSSLKGLFDGLGATLGDIPVSTGVAETTALGNDSWIPAVLVGVLVTTVVVGAATIVLNPAILLTLLISALGVAISVLFIFALFAVREAAVIVLTVVAPVAFVCYILPNTKKVFDKWLTAWKGLLLVYPVAGLLIGGGDYISRLLILVEGSGTTETGFFQLMTAMVIGIAPIFFIPSVLKGSFSALGNIGAKIAGAGKMLGGRASSRLANSSINKNAQRMGEERHARISAGLNKQGEMNALARGRAKISRRMANSKIPIVGGAIRGIGRGQMKSQASRIAAAKKDFSAGESANAMLMNEMAARGIADNGGGVDGARKYYSGLLSQAAEKGDKSGFDAALTAAAQSGYMKPKDVASMVRTMENEGKLGKLNDAEWWTRAASKHSDVMSTDFEMLSWARKGGVGGNNNPALGGYGEYAANGGVKTDDLKLEDISKLSSDSMAGLIAAGTINKGLAEQAMLNGSGLTQDKRVMLGAVASGAATSGSIQGAGGSVGEGARVFKGEAGALMQNSQATEWKDDSTGTDKKISAIHTQKTDGSATWSEGSATHATASTQDIEKWMAPSAAPVNIQNWSGGPSGPGGGGSAGPDGPSGPGGSVRGGGIAAGSSGGGAVAGETFDVRRLEEDTLLDMATNPNVEMNNPIRMVAAEEYERRTGYSSGGVSASSSETVVETAPVSSPEVAPAAEVVEAVPAPEPAPAPAPAPASVSDSRSSSDVQRPSAVQQVKTSFDQFKNPAPRPESRRPEPRPVQPPKNISQSPGITGGRRLRSADRARRMMGGSNNGGINNGGNGGTSS